MSSLVLTIHNFGVPNFDPYPDDDLMMDFNDSKVGELMTIAISSGLLNHAD